MKRDKGIRDSYSREAFRMAANVPAGDSVELTERIRGNCTLERVSIRIYIGAQLDLKLFPFIKRAQQQGTLEPVIKYCSSAGAKNYIDGDDDDYTFVMCVPLYTDDEIYIRAVNEDLVNAYDFAFDFEVDYLAGAMRVTGLGGAF